MSNHCSDCGTKTNGGVCSNCQEELYILECQSDYIDFEVSNEFAERAKEQKEYLRRNHESKKISGL